MGVKPGYKQTEVGVIPVDWEVPTLGELAKNITRGASPRPIDNPKWFEENSKVGWVRISDVTKSGRFLFETSQQLSLDGVNNSRYVPSGNLIMSICATVGRPIETRIDVCIHDGFVVFDRPKVCQTFLYHMLKRLEPSWSARGQTGSQMNLNTELIKSTRIPLPASIQEQETIAEALGDTDALIESLEALIHKKKQIKQGAMQELLTGQRRLPGFGVNVGYKETEIGKFPKDWDTPILGGLAKNITRGASPRPIDNPKWFDENSKIGWVRISDVTKAGRYLLETSQWLSPAGVNSSRIIPSGSLIMSICATVGRPIETRIDVCIHDGFVVFDRPKTCQTFLYHMLKRLEPHWSDRGQTGSQMNLNTDLIKSTRIPLPTSLKEQEIIAQVLSDMDDEIETLEEKLAKARRIKEGMMQSLLTGRIRLI